MMCMDTCCRGDRDEETVIVATTQRTARKPRRCLDCGGTIQPGEVYERVAFRFDGTFDSASRHVGGFCALAS